MKNVKSFWLSKMKKATEQFDLWSDSRPVTMIWNVGTELRALTEDIPVLLIAKK